MSIYVAIKPIDEAGIRYILMGGGVISKLIVAESFLDQTAPTMDIAA